MSRESEQRRSVSKLTESLAIEFKLNPVQMYHLKTHLDCLYDLGWVEGSKQLARRKPVIMYKEGVRPQHFTSIEQAAATIGVHRSTIGKAITYKTKIKKGGYYFKFKK